MNDNLSNFDFEGHDVRVLDHDDQPWFVAADVCRVLELLNPTMAVAPLASEEKAKFFLGHRETWCISESGLYLLTLRSRLALEEGSRAYKFRLWVTTEVLPQIRRTGRYEAAAALESTRQAAERERLGRVRTVLLESMEDKRARRITSGDAQAIALLAQRYLESIKLEGDALGYEKLLGLQDGETADGILPKRQTGAEFMQGLPQRAVPAAAADESGLPGEAIPEQEALGGEERGTGESAPGAGGDLPEEPLDTEHPH